MNATYLPFYEDSFKALEEGKCKFVFIDGGNAEFSVRGRYFGQFSHVGEPFFRKEVHFVLPKLSPYYNILTEATLELRDGGHTQTLDEYMQAEPDDEDSPQLTFKKLYMFFVLAFSACFILLAAMLVDFRRSGKNSGDDANHVNSYQTSRTASFDEHQSSSTAKCSHIHLKSIQVEK